MLCVFVVKVVLSWRITGCRIKTNNRIRSLPCLKESRRQRPAPDNTRKQENVMQHESKNE